MPSTINSGLRRSTAYPPRRSQMKDCDSSTLLESTFGIDLIGALLHPSACLTILPLLQRLHFFRIQKRVPEFRITVKQYVTPKDTAMPFVAQADRQTKPGSNARS